MRPVLEAALDLALTVNRTPRRAEIDNPDRPLVVLHEFLGQMGTQNTGLEGASGICTVQVNLDGAAVRFCRLPAAVRASQGLAKIEGLSAPADLPVQRFWQEARVPQCGWGQAGGIMAAAAVLTEAPAPDNADIVAAMAAKL